jgi:hypothetical protein
MFFLISKETDLEDRQIHSYVNLLDAGPKQGKRFLQPTWSLREKRV